MTKKLDKLDEISPYMDIEFEQFIETIKQGQAGHWKEIAIALGVNQNTITQWKNTKRAQEAIREGIAYALECMQQAGARDWRMWESKLKMLGINPASNVDLTSGGDKLTVALVEFVKSDGNRKDASKIS